MNRLYFSGHKDSDAINEYLNTLPEESVDFQVVYRLRWMGEQFVDGRLTMQSVKEYADFLPVSARAEAFIRSMKCWTFHSVLSHIAQGNCTTEFELKVLHEIESPSFRRQIPKGRISLVWYKFQRIWYSRWKHPLVFNEHFLPASITLLWSIVKREQVIKD